MANIIEIVIKMIDQASAALKGIEDKTTASTAAMSKSFEGVGTSSESVNKKLAEYGAAVDNVSRVQNQLKQAQMEAIEASNRLAQAQKELKDNTDPSKTEQLNRALVDAQVQLDKAGQDVQNLTKDLRENGEAAGQGAKGFESFAGKITALNQGMQLVGQVTGQVERVFDETVGKTVAYAKEVRDLSTNLGISVEETSKIIQASDDYGISVETVTGALEMAVKRGFSPNIETLAKLADEYNSIKDPIERAARLSDVFGRGWTSLTPILKAGGTAIREAGEEAAKLGLVLSDEDVQGARNLEVSIDNLNDRVEALKLKIGKDLIPGLVTAADDFLYLQDKIEGNVTPLDEAKRTLDRVTAAFGENSPATAKAREEYEKLAKPLEEASKMTDGVSRAEDRSKSSTEAWQKALAAAQNEVKYYADASERATKRQDAFNASMERAKAAAQVIADTTTLAIDYTEAQQKQADVQQKLDDLNKQIASHGAARAVTVKNEKLSTEELAKAQLGLAVAQEDLATVQKKANETDAEFALRVETLKGKVADYSQKLGEHTAVVGGATKAELEQKAALEGQIAALQKTEEINRAKGAFESLTQAFKEGALTEDQYRERAGALNTISGLYTQSALDQATAQEVLMKAFADPRSEAWRSQLILNQKEIDGTVEKTDAATEATKRLHDEAAKPIVPAKAEAKAEEVETPKKKGVEAYQEQLDARKKLAEADAAQKKSIEEVSVAQETASRQMKGSIDLVAGSYTGVQNAIADTKARTEEMTADAIKASQDRSAAQEAESREMKGRIDEVIGEYKKIPEKIQTKLEVVTDIQDKTKTVAGDSIAERANQARSTAQDTSKSMQDSAKKAIDAVTDIASKSTDKVTGVTVAAASALGTLATTTDNKWGAASKSVINAMTEMGNIALGELGDILNATNALPVYKKFIYEIEVKVNGTLPEGVPGFAQGVSQYKIPPNPAGGTGDYFPFMAAAGERVTVETPAQQARNDRQSGGGGDTYNYTTNVYNPLAATILADKQRRERLARSNARMGVTT